MNKRLIAFVFMALLLSPLSLYSKSSDRPHMDKSKLPYGCASCHVGHGKYNTPMLPEDKGTFCFRCHGDSLTVEKSRKAGVLSAEVKTSNVEREFEKPFHHPVEHTGIHRYNEILPERDRTVARHSECGDCHHHHLVAKENKTLGLKGVNVQGLGLENTQFEYELCFKCHSYSANLPGDQTNKAELFNPSNPSYHPVVAEGKTKDVPSLRQPLDSSKLIKCTDCHNNDDPTGIKGPHGSNHKHILARNFSDTDGPEGTFQYELCYYCHQRNSILHNESFQYHDLHITTVAASCRTCHNPHGSTQNPHLLDFDNFSIRPSSTGRLAFVAIGNKAGQCYLTCHDKNHDPAMYPSAPASSQSSAATSTSKSKKK